MLIEKSVWIVMSRMREVGGNFGPWDVHSRQFYATPSRANKAIRLLKERYPNVAADYEAFRFDCSRDEIAGAEVRLDRSEEYRRNHPKPEIAPEIPPDAEITGMPPGHIQ